jgi:predicted phage-related endonuclease
MTNIIALSPQRIITDETYEHVELFRDIRRQMKMLEKDEADVKDWLIKGHFATHNEFVYNNRILLTYDERSRDNIDSKRLKEELPEVYEKYNKRISYNQFTLK